VQAAGRPIESVSVRGGLIVDIAREHLLIPTLESRRADSLDFHDVAVWQVEAALKAAFDAGMRSAGTVEPERPRRAARAALLLIDMVRYGIISLGDGEAEFQETIYAFDATAPDWQALVDAIGWDTAAALVLKEAVE
jgi:hypothetical protein